ncbi:MAG: cytochrome c-type biogenesis protein CcmH [Acidobacteria bacterium]|nr:cytochrome c-type biogenesis protein CcmH [Acidobacteriota bacterium]
MRPPDPGARSARSVLRPVALFLLALTLGAMVAAPASAQTDPAAARGAGMTAPHPPPAPGGVEEKSPDVMKVTTRVLCMCGGCVNQTLHECTCGMAADERDKVASKIAAGGKPDDIIKAYVDEFGPQILATPEKTGINLVGWLVPFAVAILLLASLTVVLRGWVRPETVETVGPSASIAESSAPGDPVERRYRERLEKELKEHEG